MYTGYKPYGLNGSQYSKTLTRTNFSSLESFYLQIDNYTKKLEQEKRKRQGIDQTLRAVKRDQLKSLEKLSALKKEAGSCRTFKKHVDNKNLQAVLDKIIAKYDQIAAVNSKLKREIDQLRKQKKNLTQVYKNLMGQESEYLQDIKERNEDNMEMLRQNKKLAVDLKEVDQKNDDEKARITHEFEEREKSYKQIKEERLKEKIHQIHDKVEMIDTQSVLRLRLKRIINKNYEKVKLMEDYQKKMRLIVEAFNEIKTGSGIGDIEEITNVFIKSEEQNHSLYNYLDSLSQAYYSLDEQHRQLQAKIELLERENELKKKKLYEVPEFEQRHYRLQKQIKEKENFAEQLRDIIQAIKPDLEKALVELSKSQYNDDPNKVFDYELGFNFNENNIEQYLGDFEKYVNILAELRIEAKSGSFAFELRKEPSRLQNKEEALTKLLNQSTSTEDKSEVFLPKDKLYETAKQLIGKRKKAKQ